MWRFFSIVFQIKERNAALYCECSGSFETTFSEADLATKMRTFVNLATFYEMPTLKAICDWILAGNPSLFSNISHV